MPFTRLIGIESDAEALFDHFSGLGVHLPEKEALGVGEGRTHLEELHYCANLPRHEPPMSYVDDKAV
jgi:hypothetical protein